MRISLVRTKRLWAAIIDYGESREEVGAEGNSGEFHSASEERSLDRDLSTSTNDLLAAFIDATGWEPIQVNGSWTDWVKVNGG